PAWCTLALSMPEPDTRWLDAFLDGFSSLAAQHGIALVGGDTTRGPLSVCVTAHGFVEPGHALRRDGARVDDTVWVTGMLGDAAGALRQWRAGTDIDPAFCARLQRPTPRIAIGRALGALATACIDISDGLLADLGHIAHASDVGIVIAIDDLPRSSAFSDAFDEHACRELAASGGDDYELCFTAPTDADAQLSGIAEATQTRLTRIGRVVAGKGVTACDAAGVEWISQRNGYDHFAA
ncbi:MAG: thiamine-phosphate kinase, partial [Luteimonas sp.]